VVQQAKSKKKKKEPQSKEKERLESKSTRKVKKGSFKVGNPTASAQSKFESGQRSRIPVGRQV